MAEALRLSAQYDLAQAMCRRLLQRDPRDAKALHQLALLAHQAGDSAQACELMQACAAELPDDAGIQCDLGGLFNLQGRLPEAVACFRRALRLAPQNSQAHYNLGCTLQAQGLLLEAEGCYRQALAIEPANTTILSNLGGCLLEQRNIDAAIACFREAVVADAGDVKSLNNLGTALQSAGRHGEAKSCFENAIELDPSFARSYVNLGMLHHEQGELGKAEANHREALKLDPNFVEAHFSLGVTLHALHRLDEAADSYRHAIAINPRHVKSQDNLVMTLQFVATVGSEELLAAHRRFADQFEAPLKPFWTRHGNIADPSRRIRIGYVSGDFREHAVAYFIEPVFRHYDRAQFEVFAYSNNPKNDAVTARLRASVDHWRDVATLTDADMAMQIRADAIDILIDLSGHTAHNRLLVFARKPAPIQITYLGYLSTTGLESMDYRLTDHLAEPAGSERYYTETLLHMPDSMWCYQPPADVSAPAPAITPLPALENGYLTFGSFNNVDKIGADAITLWAALLQHLPTSRLLFLAAPEVHAHFLRQFDAHGIAAERITFFGKLAPDEFRRLVQRADISLDSYPVNGATTTCESLWQGVPVLSLSGERVLSRNGQSILSAAQLPDFCATTPIELIKTARLLADNPAVLANIRAGMREHLRTTPLLHQRHFVENLEALLRDAWRKWCRTAK